MGWKATLPSPTSLLWFATYWKSWITALIWHSFQDTKQRYEWKHMGKRDQRQQGDVKWEGESMTVFSGNFQTWDESSFTVSVLCENSILETAGLPIVAESIEDYKKTAQISSAIHITKSFVNMCLLCTCLSVYGWWWLVTVGGFTHLHRHSCSELVLCSVRASCLLQPEDLISLYNLLAQMPTCMHQNTLTFPQADARPQSEENSKTTYGTWSCTAGREGSSNPSWFCSRAGWHTPHGCRRAQCRRCQSLGCGTWEEMRNRPS